MIRKAFVMQVNPDAHEEYARRHNPIWPELEAASMEAINAIRTLSKRVGIPQGFSQLGVSKADIEGWLDKAHHYAIYLDKERNLLFATVEIESEARWEAVASTEVCQRWWKYMREVMPSNPDNSPLSVELKEVFYLA